MKERVNRFVETENIPDPDETYIGEPDFSMGVSLYQVLGIRRKASPETIKKAYRRLAKKYHPDVADKNDITAPTKWEWIKDAYDILIVPELRRGYDEPKKQPRTETPNNEALRVVVACQNSMHAIVRGRRANAFFSDEQLTDLFYALSQFEKYFYYLNARDQRAIGADIRFLHEVRDRNRDFFVRQARGELKIPRVERAPGVRVVRERGGAQLYLGDTRLSGMFFDSAMEVGGFMLARRGNERYVINPKTGQIKFGRVFSNHEIEGKVLMLSVDGYRLPSYFIGPDDEELGPEVMSYNRFGNKIGLKTKDGFFEIGVNDGKRKKLSDSEAQNYYGFDRHGI